jgi:hypothetical protein
MSSRISDAVRLRIIQLIEQFNELPAGVRIPVLVTLIIGVLILGVWSGAFSKGHPQASYSGR